MKTDVLGKQGNLKLLRSVLKME